MSARVLKERKQMSEKSNGGRILPSHDELTVCNNLHSKFNTLHAQVNALSVKLDSQMTIFVRGVEFGKTPAVHEAVADMQNAQEELSEILDKSDEVLGKVQDIYKTNPFYRTTYVDNGKTVLTSMWRSGLDIKKLFDTNSQNYTKNVGSLAEKLLAVHSACEAMEHARDKENGVIPDNVLGRVAKTLENYLPTFSKD